MRALSTRSLNSDINVTPLVDVCLVLLIIFMVVLPSMVNGVDVSLPRTSSITSVDERILPITVKEDGSVYLGTLVIRRDEVLSSLQRMRATDASRRSPSAPTSACGTARSSPCSPNAAKRDGRT